MDITKSFESLLFMDEPRVALFHASLCYSLIILITMLLSLPELPSEPSCLLHQIQ